MIIRSSALAFQLFRNHLTSDVEEFWVAALNSAKKVIRIEMLFRGTVDSCLIHPRDVFRFAVANNACSLIVAHNHPSGEGLPSAQDIGVTRNLVRAGELLQIPLIDHLILYEDRYYSFIDEGILHS